MFAVIFVPILLLHFFIIWKFTCLLVQITWSITITCSKLRTPSWFINLCRLSAIWYFKTCFGELFLLILCMFSNDTSGSWKVTQVLNALAEMESRFCFKSDERSGVTRYRSTGPNRSWNQEVFAFQMRWRISLRVWDQKVALFMALAICTLQVSLQSKVTPSTFICFIVVISASSNLILTGGWSFEWNRQISVLSFINNKATAFKPVGDHFQTFFKWQKVKAKFLQQKCILVWVEVGWGEGWQWTANLCQLVPAAPAVKIKETIYFFLKPNNPV